MLTQKWPAADVSLRAFLAVGILFVGLPIGCSYASVQFIFPNRIRGLASAVVILFVNLIGLGIGSALPGILTDSRFKDETKVGASIALTVAISSLTGLIVTALALRPYRRHYAQMHAG